MFCSECGTQATGKFCWNCGHRLHDAVSTSTPAPNVPKSAKQDEDWAQMIDYETLLQVQEVKDFLAHQIPATSLMTGEQFLSLFGKVVSTSGILAADLYSRMGVKTSKVRSQHLSRPCGKVPVAVLCHLAQATLQIQTVQQTSDACILICTIPSDMLSFKGELIVTVTRKGTSTQLEAATKIPGQKYDWGKSKKILERLFESAVKDI